MICQPQDCFGCAACHDICPQNAISMSDELGWWRPVINEASCVHCDLCKNICPVLVTQQSQQNATDEYNPICYAAWSRNDDLHFNCASGGLASELALEIINPGGFVAGAVFDEDIQCVRHAVIDKIDNAKFLSKSKYVLSNKSGVYKEVAHKLQQNVFGLFVGVPCEVNALQNYLSHDKIPQDRLYIVDLLCRGGSSPLCLDKHIKWISKGKKIKNVTFRGGNYDCQFVVWGKDDQIVYRGFQYTDTYFKNFMNHSLFQERCYTCPFAGKKRVGDLTLGDFWGLASSVQEKSPVTGISLVLVNTAKGKALLKRISHKIEMHERPYSEAVAGNDTLKEPTEKPPEYDEFWQIIREKGFNTALKNVYQTSETKSYLKNIYLKERYRMAKFVKRILGGG